jgi:(R,R)-butanediol dehydrogenase / meso-butanediol dehydrogenase / diacetyl reductase
VPAERLRPLAVGVDPRLGVLAEPLANGVHAARIGQSGVEGGPTGHVVVIGGGTIGLMTLQAAMLGGAEWAGVLEPNADRRAAAAALGATATFGDEAELRATIAGVDLVFDAVGLVATRRLALELLRPGGCTVMIGLHSDAAPVDFHPLVRRGLTVRGSYAYTDADYDAALQLLLDGRAGLGELEPIQPLADGPDVFAELAAGPTTRLKVFLAA